MFDLGECQWKNRREKRITNAGEFVVSAQLEGVYRDWRVTIDAILSKFVCIDDPSAELKERKNESRRKHGQFCERFREGSVNQSVSDELPEILSEVKTKRFT